MPLLVTRAGPTHRGRSDGQGGVRGHSTSAGPPMLARCRARSYFPVELSNPPAAYLWMPNGSAAACTCGSIPAASTAITSRDGWPCWRSWRKLRRARMKDCATSCGEFQKAGV
jgi:hypothetical protein